MEEPHERLKVARLLAGYSSATEAAKAFGWTVSTYLGHENGSRGLQADAAQRYGRAYRVPWTYLLTGHETGGTANADFGVAVVGTLGWTSGDLADPALVSHVIPVGAEGYSFEELIAVTVRPGPTLDCLITSTDPKQPILYGDELLVSVEDDGGLIIGTVLVGRTNGGTGPDYFAPTRGFPDDELHVPLSEAQFQALPGLRFRGIVVAAYQDKGRRKALESDALRNLR